MKLVSPNGVIVSVSDEKGERLLKQGYKRVEPVRPAPLPPPPPPVVEEEPPASKKRTRRKAAEA